MNEKWQAPVLGHPPPRWTPPPYVHALTLDPPPYDGGPTIELTAQTVEVPRSTINVAAIIQEKILPPANSALPPPVAHMTYTFGDPLDDDDHTLRKQTRDISTRENNFADAAWTYSVRSAGSPFPQHCADLVGPRFLNKQPYELQRMAFVGNHIIERSDPNSADFQSDTGRRAAYHHDRRKRGVRHSGPVSRRVALSECDRLGLQLRSRHAHNRLPHYGSGRHWPQDLAWPLGASSRVGYTL